MKNFCPSLNQAYRKLLKSIDFFLDNHNGSEITDQRRFMNIPRFDDFPKVIYAYKFPRWKWPIVRQCFLGRKVVFVNKDSKLPANGVVALWGMMPAPANLSQHISIIRVEDGFLRSVGLGADLVRPVSWVIDNKGIYYNTTGASDLEEILNNLQLDQTLIARAAKLRTQIIENGLTKYNTGLKTWQRPNTQKKIILVVGQVESDASIIFGAPQIKGNMELLRKVRMSNLDAYCVYKPHPDVIARLRILGKDENNAQLWCDEVVTDVVMGDLLNSVDEVHVLTSLAGFEAMLRGKSVICHGQPFYSGWGLTNDIVPNQRRNRQLTIDELVAGVLIEYPLYLSVDGIKLITPEEALESLLHWRNTSANKNIWRQEIFRVFLRIFAGVK